MTAAEVVGVIKDIKASGVLCEVVLVAALYYIHFKLGRIEMALKLLLRAIPPKKDT